MTGGPGHRFDAVVFDFDGTIIDTETAVFESWRQTYERLGVEPLSWSAWRSNIGHTSQPFHPLDELEHRLGAAGTALDRESVVASRLALRDSLLEKTEPRPGILDWMDTADARGLPMAVASSSSLRWVTEQLRRIGLLDRFRAVCCAGDGVPGKPDPAVYLRACETLGVEPHRSVAIEDSPVGAQAASAAGMWVIAAPGPMTTGLRFDAANEEVPVLAALAPDDYLGAPESG